MKRIWIYLINPFLVATEGSYRLAVRISTWHDSALKAASADLFIAGLYAIYHPIHVKFVAAYDAWVAQGGMQQGETLNLKQLLKLLSNIKINAWDAAIQVVYAKDTPQYKALMAKGHYPFQQGTQTQRFSAVKALSEAIGSDADLATVKADIDAYYEMLNDANTSQKGSKSTTTTFSDAVEAGRIRMCVAQYSNLGKLIGEHADDTSVISPYFDLEAVRKGQQVFFEGHVLINKSHLIVQHTFATSDKLKLQNTGNTELQFYLSATKKNGLHKTVVTLAAGTEQTVSINDLGDIASHFLMVFNPDMINKGEFVVEMV